VDVDIADGPWKVIKTTPVNVNPLPTADLRARDELHTGLVLIEGSKPRIIVLEGPTSIDKALSRSGVAMPVPPPNMAHRFAAVLKDGTEWPIQSSLLVPGPGHILPARHWEDIMERMFSRDDAKNHVRAFLASDVKAIRYEYRPITKTIKFEHVAVAPSK